MKSTKGGVEAWCDNVPKCFAVTRLTEDFYLGQGTLEYYSLCRTSMKITTCNIIGLTDYMVIDDSWVKLLRQEQTLAFHMEV